MTFFNKSSLFKHFSFVLFIGLIPYKILGIFQVDPIIRLFIGGACILLAIKMIKEVVPFFFNNPVIQLLFFYFMSFEEYMRSKSIKYQLFIGITLGFSLGAWPNQTDNPLFWYLLMGFFISLYFNFKKIFLNPEFEGNIYVDNKDLNLEDLSWEQIHKNMENISIVFFGLPIRNQLGSSLSNKSFPQISKRYMWSRLGRTLQRHVDIFSGGAVFGSVFGFSVSEYRNQARHDEAMVEARRSNDIAQAQLEQTKRSNDLQERLAKLQKDSKNVKLQVPSESDSVKSTGWKLWSSFEEVSVSKYLKIFEVFFPF